MDADGDGKISKAELNSAFAAKGSDAERTESIFAKLDSDGDGSISQRELAAAIDHRRNRDDPANAPSFDGALAELKQAAATTETTTAPDGSMTTVLTYSDGTKVTVTTPAPAKSAG